MSCDNFFFWAAAGLACVCGVHFILIVIPMGFYRYFSSRKRLSLAKEAFRQGNLREAFQRYKEVFERRFLNSKGVGVGIGKSHFAQARQGLAEVYEEAGIEYDFAPLMAVRKRILACLNEYAKLRTRFVSTERRLVQIEEALQQELSQGMEEYEDLLAALPSV
jgi:hypothetical protein